MDLGFSFFDWFVSLGFIVGVIGMVGLVGGAVTVLAVPADHPALQPPPDGEEQLRVSLGERQPAARGLATMCRDAPRATPASSVN